MSIALIQRAYRRFAPLYDLVFGAGLAPGRRAALAALECRPGERVLEVCIGTGSSLPLYPAQARVTGIDVSRDMLEKAAARVAAQRLSQVEALLQMDAAHLAFADGSFDKVTLLFALSGLPDPLRAVHEIRRVCRPGGTIVIANHFRGRSALLRACDVLLAPLHRMIRYRSDMDLERFLAAAQLEVLAQRQVNLFGYATLLVCRNRSRLAAVEQRHGAAPHVLAEPSARAAPAGQARAGR